MLITEKGILEKKGEVKKGLSKSGSEWANQVLVIKCTGYKGKEYRIAPTASYRELDQVEQINEGDPVIVTYYVSAREWQGKWYNQIDLNSIARQEEAPVREVIHPANPQPQPEPPVDLGIDAPGESPDLPF